MYLQYALSNEKKKYILICYLNELRKYFEKHGQKQLV